MEDKRKVSLEESWMSMPSTSVSPSNSAILQSTQVRSIRQFFKSASGRLPATVPWWT
jgi:hypothetical protein